MSADVDQFAGRGVGPGVHCLLDGLVAAADRGDGEEGDRRVDQPAPWPVGGVASDTECHPDRGREGCGRPHPAEHRVGRRDRPEQQATQSQECGGCCRPALWSIAEPRRQDAQHRPSEAEPAQHCAGLACSWAGTNGTGPGLPLRRVRATRRPIRRRRLGSWEPWDQSRPGRKLWSGGGKRGAGEMGHGGSPFGLAESAGVWRAGVAVDQERRRARVRIRGIAPIPIASSTPRVVRNPARH